MSASNIKQNYQRVLEVFLADSGNTLQQLLEKDDIAVSLYAWLAKLKLLHGVPFRYLVPDERMLPPESIKFFNIDLNWVNALVDGAFSIGNHAAKDVNNKTIMHKLSDSAKPMVDEQSDSAARNVRRRVFKLADVSNKDAFAPITGFLLRSEVVSGWKGVQVTAFDRDHYPDNPAGNGIIPLRLLRFEPLSDTLVIALFEGQAYRVDIHEPSEGLHFGFDLDVQGRLSKNLRDPNKGTSIEGHSISHEDLVKDGIFRDNGQGGTSARNAGGQVINMYKMSHLLYRSLCNAPKEDQRPTYQEAVPQILEGTTQTHTPIVSDKDATPLVSSDFALQMIEGVGMVSFYNTSMEEGG